MRYECWALDRKHFSPLGSSFLNFFHLYLFKSLRQEWHSMTSLIWLQNGINDEFDSITKWHKRWVWFNYKWQKQLVYSKRINDRMSFWHGELTSIEKKKRKTSIRVLRFEFSNCEIHDSNFFIQMLIFEPQEFSWAQFLFVFWKTCISFLSAIILSKDSIVTRIAIGILKWIKKPISRD